MQVIERSYSMYTCFNLVCNIKIEHGCSCFHPRLPKTICFGRGSSRAFQKSIPKNSKKKSKNLDDVQDQAASQEVVKNSKINYNQAFCI